MGLAWRGFAAALLIGAAQPAGAAWHVAKSKHFIIYSDEKPSTLQDFATRLEKFDLAVRGLLRMKDPPVGDGNRLTIFVVPNDVEVRKLAGDKTGWLQGFYTGRVEGSLAYVPKRSSVDFEGGLGAQPIFFHEYAHHLMMQELEHPFPEWYVEGFAEFLSTPKFERDGAVGLGTPLQDRTYGLLNTPLPLEKVLASSNANLNSEQRDALYGRAWLLVHYLTMEKNRAGQLNRYIAEVSKGQSQLDAARAAFGDLRQLEKELNAYLNRSRLAYFKVAGPTLRPGPIQVQSLSRAAGEVMPLRWRMKNGVADAEKKALAAQVRQLQASYPGDELVEATLAEAELDAGNFDAAAAAAERASKANPSNTEAIVLKGRALVEKAALAEGDQSALFSEARNLFIAANKIDAEDPEPLMEFYKAYLREGKRPTANAIAALHYASNLAPQDIGVRMNSAIAYLRENKFKEARATLVPVAYSPHGGDAAEDARRAIASIDAGQREAAIQAAYGGSKTR